MDILQRAFRSFVATTLFVIILSYPLGFFELIKFHEVEFIPLSELASFLLILFAVNLFADYISLQETRLIMKFSNNKNFSVIFVLFIIDIIITFFIFVLSWELISFIFEGDSLSFDDFLYVSQATFDIIVHPVFPDLVFTVGSDSFLHMYQPFVFSTFMTSILWFLFVLSSLIIRILVKLSPILELCLLTISRSRRPARATAGFLMVPLIIALIVIFIAESVSGKLG